MRKLHTAVRIGALGALFVLICAVYLVILVNVQITGQDYYDIIKEDNKNPQFPIPTAQLISLNS